MTRKYRRFSMAFKRQLVEAYLAGTPLRELSSEHKIERGLLRSWINKYDAGELGEKAVLAETIRQHEATIAELDKFGDTNDFNLWEEASGSQDCRPGPASFFKRA